MGNIQRKKLPVKKGGAKAGAKKVLKKPSPATAPAKDEEAFEAMKNALVSLAGSSPEALAGVFEVLQSQLETFTDKFIEAYSTVEKDADIPQAYLDIGERLEQITGIAKKTRDAFGGFLLGRVQAPPAERGKGSFQHGAVGVAFPTTAKASPKWKEEAISEARKHRTLQYGVTAVCDDATQKKIAKVGEEFDFKPDDYVKEVQAEYGKKTTTSVKLSRSA